MQENIEAFVNRFGIEHCFEFTITAKQLDPAEFSKRLNSALTNYLGEKFPDRVMVIEPHKSGHAHSHCLVAVPFRSPGFNHEALAASREAFKKKDFGTSKRLWRRVWDSMGAEHQACWNELRERLPAYGLGNMISLAPVRESARAIACYFGKYLAKGIAERPEAWKGVRLVRYSQGAPWRYSSPQRSGTSRHDVNHRDKLEAVAKHVGVTSEDGFSSVLGPRWHYHAREFLERVQLPVYRSLLHADTDAVPGIRLPEGTTFEWLPTGHQAVHFPASARTDPYFPTEQRENHLTPAAAAYLILERAAPHHLEARLRLRSMMGAPTGSKLFAKG